MERALARSMIFFSENTSKIHMGHIFSLLEPGTMIFSLCPYYGQNSGEALWEKDLQMLCGTLKIKWSVAFDIESKLDECPKCQEGK